MTHLERWLDQQLLRMIRQTLPPEVLGKYPIQSKLDYYGWDWFYEVSFPQSGKWLGHRSFKGQTRVEAMRKAYQFYLDWERNRYHG